MAENKLFLTRGELLNAFLGRPTDNVIRQILDLVTQANEAPPPDEVVIGPAGATDNALARFDGTTGKLVKNSTAILDNFGNLLLTGNLVVNGNTTLGDAGTDTLAVLPNAITWTNNPTHSGNHTFSGDVSTQGNTSIGNANTDTLTVAPNAVTWSNNPTHSGNHTFSGNVAIAGAVNLGDAAGDTITVTGTPAGQIVAGTYTPTASAAANLDSTPTLSLAQYMRVGATVTVSGTFTADPTTTATPTSFEFSLPIASNIGAIADAAGVAFSGAVAGMGAQITGSVANNTAVVTWQASDTASQVWSFSMTYRII